MSIPKGYKLVPVEPTPEMMRASWDCANTRTKWQAMVDTAPTPPEPIYDEAKERELFEASATSALGRDSEGDYLATDTYLRWQGWKDCAQSRAKAGEVGHE